MTRLIAIAALALLLAGCASRGPASIAGGECKIFEAPKYEVRGRSDYDQDWIDSQVEGGIGGCHWKRPRPRPAAIDAAPAPRALPAKPARRGIITRIRDRVLGAPAPVAPAAAVAPIAPIAPAPAIDAAPVVPDPVPAIVPDPAPAPRPRSAIERLLEPRDGD